MSLVVNNVKRELREAVFGEFREKLIELEKALYEWKPVDMKEIIREILREVEG